MPPSSVTSGTRRPEDERQILTDLAKLFHVVRAHYKERENTRRAAATQRRTSRRAEKKANRPRGRRNRCGGTVWITLKGGFATSAVPPLSDTAAVRRKALGRGALAERKRVEALAAAEAYVESAWEALEAAGLGSARERTASCEEGVAYLREQFGVAIDMLESAQRRTPGAVLTKIVANSVGSGVATAAAVCTPLEKKDIAAYRVERAMPAIDWESVAQREMAIWQNPFTRKETSAAATLATEEAFKQTVSSAGAQYYYTLGEPGSSGSSSTNTGAVRSPATADIAATKCIIRIRNSRRQKHTAILSTAKAVNYFKSNFGAVVRKELNNAKLLRGGVDDAAGTHAQTTPKPQKPSQQPKQGGGGGGRGKKRGKR